ncbi:MAG: trimethylamine methyltransferase family protein [Planctomycetota bacterium]
MRLLPRKFRILDEKTCDRLHKEALELLRTVGFRVYSRQVRNLLNKAGAKVDEAAEIVTLPCELVNEAISSFPSEFDIYDLDGRPTRLRKGTIAQTISSYAEAVAWLDYQAEKLRPSTLDDLEKAVKLADSLPLINKIGAIVTPLDVPASKQTCASLLAILNSTRKRLHFGIQNPIQARLIHEAVSTAAPEPSRTKLPCCEFVCSSISPLVFDKDSAETMTYCIEHNMVPLLAPCPMAGGTSQFSLIGTIFQQAVENLFLATAVYAVKPGTPVLWGGAGAAMDMCAADVSYGGIERSIILLANIDLAVYYNIPVNSPAGSLDSCLIDAQAGAEKTWTFFTRLLSNAASGICIGAVANGRAASAEQLVIDVDIVKSIIRFSQGVETNHLEEAISEIKDVGPGGNFMSSPATINLLRKGQEYFYPATFNRSGTHAPSVLERAHEQVETILSEWKSPVPEGIRSELEILLARN